MAEQKSKLILAVSPSWYQQVGLSVLLSAVVSCSWPGQSLPGGFSWQMSLFLAD